MEALLLRVVTGFFTIQENSTVHWDEVIASIVNQYSQSVHIFDLTSDQVNSNVLIQSLGIPVVFNASFTNHENQARLYLVLCSNIFSYIIAP